MDKRSNTKLKTLYLLKILHEQSDMDHPMNAHDLVDALQKYGIKAERKSIYDSLQALKDYGLQIEQAVPAYHGWFLDDKMFQDPELLLLIEAIESSNIINREKSEELVGKLLDSSLSIYEKKRFKERYSYSANANKPENNRAIYHIETISQAIEEKKKLEITYSRDTVDGPKERVHIVTPYALIWSDDTYYLICNTRRHDNFMHMRLDRMKKVNKRSEEARSCAEFSEDFPDGNFNAELYRREMFNGYSGVNEAVTLRCNDSLFSTMRDRFGPDIEADTSREDGTFTFRANVMAGEGFLRWISQFGDQVMILEPAKLRKQMADRMRDTLNLYKEGTQDETDTED